MMSSLAQVPAWFWVALGTILALAGLVAGVIGSRDRRYHPGHRLDGPVPGSPAAVYMPAALATVPVAAVSGQPPWEVAHEPTAAEVARSRAAHGYIPELDPDADRGGFDGAGDRCISCGAEIDHYLGCPDDPGPDYEAEAELHERLCGPEQLHEKPAGTESAGSGHTRLADTGDVMDAHLAADVTAELRRQDADVAAWLAALDGRYLTCLLELAAAL